MVEVIAQLNVGMTPFIKLQMKQSLKTIFDFHRVYFIAPRVVEL